MDIWQFLHVAAMFAAVSIFVGQGLLEGAVARSGDVPALRRVLAAEDRFAPLGGGLFLLGIAFGVITAITGSMDHPAMAGHRLRPGCDHPRQRVRLPHPDREPAEGVGRRQP